MSHNRGRKGVTAVIRGPVVEGNTAAPVARMIRDVDKAVGDRLLDEWRKLLRASVKRWTGHYSRTLATRETNHTYRVYDTGKTAYGPWLEGTSRRNQRTRFKGYHALRRARQQVDRDAKRLADHVVHAHLSDFQ